MKIKVLNNYGGIYTKEQRILPGVYDADDPRLHGARAIAHMLEARHAVVVSDDTPLTDTVYTRPPDDFEFHNQIMALHGRPPVESPDTEALPDAIPQAGIRPSGDSPFDYDTLKNAELRDLLDQMGIAYGNRDNKAALIARLTGTDETDRDE